MVGSRSLTPITEQEYEAIELAVMETARGRWFLSEFARRNRHADTGVLLDAIGRLETAVAGDRAASGVDRIRFDLQEMAKAIARTKLEIAAIQAPESDGSRLMAASEALDAIVRTTERATSDILEAAERVQEVAWTLREAGASHASCDELDRRATEIYTACSFQDLTAQRTTRIVNTLRYLEDRIAAMMAIWDGGLEQDDAPPPKAAAPAPLDLSQSDVDRVIAVEAEVVPVPPPAAPPLVPVPDEDDLVFLTVADEAQDEPAAEPAPADGPDARMSMALVELDTMRFVRETRPRLPLAQAFGDIDALPVQERLLRFT